MKRVVLIIMTLVVLIILPACNYNGEATVIVKNIGDLTIFVQLENSTMILYGGDEEEFTITWPGKDDVHLNLTTYPLAYKETIWDDQNFWVKDGEIKYIEIEFHSPELTK